MNAGTVEYMLRARDMISPALSNASRMANTADRNINGINRAADAVGKQAPGKINRLTASMQASSTSATSLASNSRERKGSLKWVWIWSKHRLGLR